MPRVLRRVLGWPLLSSGVLLMNWFFWTLRNAGTPTNPEKPVSSLVTDGPFRYTRNPGYLSMAMIYTGVASLANALWAILLLPAALAAIQRGVVEREERYLERKFGERFVAGRLGTGKIRWPELTAGWNRSQQDPKKRYGSRNGLSQAFSRFLRPKYKSPTFPDYEPTPWQEAERAEGEAVLAASPKVISRQ